MQHVAGERNRVRDTAAYRAPLEKGIAALANTFKQSSGEAFQAFEVEELFADIHNESIVGTGSQEVLAKISSTAGFWQAFRGKEKSEVCVNKENLHVTLQINKISVVKIFIYPRLININGLQMRFNASTWIFTRKNIQEQIILGITHPNRADWNKQRKSTFFGTTI